MAKDFFKGLVGQIQKNKTQSLNTSQQNYQNYTSFTAYLQQMEYLKTFGQNELKTYSPLDQVGHFEQNVLQSIREVSQQEMISDTQAIKRLLANMLVHCQPGSLDAEDVQQLSGINGREIFS